MLSRRLSAFLVLSTIGCGDKAGDKADAASSSGPAASSSGPATTSAGEGSGPPPTTTMAATTGAATTTGADEVEGVELMQRLAGLWSGPASMTPLGTFPQMNMDVRAASGRVLFSRADLDEDNSLRFAFEVEAPSGAPTLVYRNGGYFLGILRDSRAALVERSADAWRFCSTGAGGCDYIDAMFTFASDEQLVFDAKVKGKQHVYWQATRKEPRTLPAPFPADLEPLADDAPFPDMPSLVVDVGWNPPLMMDGEVWVVLSTSNCDPSLACTASRSLRKAALMDDTAATLTIDQIHAGDYKLNAILDRNGNFAETQFPDSGDGLGALNKPVTVAPEGQTKASTTILFTL